MVRVVASSVRRRIVLPEAAPSIGRVDPCGVLARRWPQLLGTDSRAILPRQLGEVASPQVIVVDAAGDDGGSLVRLVRAMAPDARLVAVGTSEDDVDAAFVSGADVVIHRSADDTALHAAIHGALPRPEGSGRWWRRRTDRVAQR